MKTLFNQVVDHLKRGHRIEAMRKIKKATEKENSVLLPSSLKEVKMVSDTIEFLMETEASDQYDLD